MDALSLNDKLDRSGIHFYIDMVYDNYDKAYYAHLIVNYIFHKLPIFKGNNKALALLSNFVWESSDFLDECVTYYLLRSIYNYFDLPMIKEAQVDVDAPL